MRLIDAQIRYYFHIDPDLLSDEEWAARANELKWIREMESKHKG